MKGITKRIACPNGWTKLADLYEESTYNGSKFSKAMVSVDTNKVLFAYADATPNITTAHPMTDSDYLMLGVQDFNRIYFKNAVSGTVGYLVVTPEIEF